MTSYTNVSFMLLLRVVYSKQFCCSLLILDSASVQSVLEEL